MTATNERTGVALVTGATGFLGGAVAVELLERHASVQPLFLVRANDARAGLEKLRRHLARFDPSPEALARLTEDAILCGDLETFGGHVQSGRAAQVTHVINSAALVSFAWRRDVWRTNVEHSGAFAETLAGLPALRRCVHVSTAMVSGSSADQIVYEDDFPGRTRQFTLYTKSKAEIERRLPALLDGALVIARPSIVVGHTRVGCTPSASLFWLFRAMHAAQRLPFSPERLIDVVPVDFCAQALVHLLFKDELAHVRYHVSAGPQASCSFAEIDEAYGRARGETARARLEVFDVDDPRLLGDDFHAWFGACERDRASAAIRVYRAFAALNVTFDNSRLLAEGVAPPPRFAGYVEACVRTGEHKSIAEQMAHDSR